MRRPLTLCTFTGSCNPELLLIRHLGSLSLCLLFKESIANFKNSDGTTGVHYSSQLIKNKFFVEIVSPCVAQVGLKLLGSSNRLPLVSQSAEIKGVSYCTWLKARILMSDRARLMSDKRPAPTTTPPKRGPRKRSGRRGERMRRCAVVGRAAVTEEATSADCLRRAQKDVTDLQSTAARNYQKRQHGVLLSHPGWSAVPPTRLSAICACQPVPLRFKQFPASVSQVVGIISALHHACLIFVFLVEMGFHHLGQADLELLTL
ncbi:hypothetical protein AAY473_010522 [Plecturocebus cupreus]